MNSYTINGITIPFKGLVKVSEHCGNIRVVHEKFEMFVKIDSVPESIRLTKDINDSYKHWYVTNGLDREEFLAYSILKALGPITEVDVVRVGLFGSSLAKLARKGAVKHNSNRWEVTL